MKLNCNPLKLIQFLFLDLKIKLKDFVPDGEGLTKYERCLCNEQLFPYPISHSDEREISKVFKEINYAIKQALLEEMKLLVRSGL